MHQHMCAWSSHMSDSVKESCLVLSCPLLSGPVGHSLWQLASDRAVPLKQCAKQRSDGTQRYV